ncbi:Transcription factor TFIIIB component B, partial [Blyttiomyces sp. JEL0837]
MIVSSSVNKAKSRFKPKAGPTPSQSQSSTPAISSSSQPAAADSSSSDAGNQGNAVAAPTPQPQATSASASDPDVRMGNSDDISQPSQAAESQLANQPSSTAPAATESAEVSGLNARRRDLPPSINISNSNRESPAGPKSPKKVRFATAEESSQLPDTRSESLFESGQSNESQRPEKRPRSGSVSPRPESPNKRRPSSILVVPTITSQQMRPSNPIVEARPTSYFDDDEEMEVAEVEKTQFVRPVLPPRITSKKVPTPTNDQRVPDMSRDISGSSSFATGSSEMEIDQDRSRPTGEEDNSGEVSEEDIRRMSLKKLMALNSNRLKASSKAQEERRRRREIAGREGSVASQGNVSKAGSTMRSRSNSPAVQQQLVTPSASTPISASRAGPRIHIVDGEIRVDVDSLVVPAGTPAEQEDMEILDETAATQHITSASFQTNKIKGHRWTAEDTLRFHKYVQYFGTDFNMISLLFPRLTRRHIKYKYNMEERINPKKLTESLMHKLPPPDDVLEEMRLNQTRRLEQRYSGVTRESAPPEGEGVKPEKQEAEPENEGPSQSSVTVQEVDEDVAPKTSTSGPPLAVEAEPEPEPEAVVIPAVASILSRRAVAPSTSKGPSFKPKMGPKKPTKPAQSGSGEPSTSAATTSLEGSSSNSQEGTHVVDATSAPRAVSPARAQSPTRARSPTKAAPPTLTTTQPKTSVSTGPPAITTTARLPSPTRSGPPIISSTTPAKPGPPIISSTAPAKVGPPAITSTRRSASPTRPAPAAVLSPAATRPISSNLPSTASVRSQSPALSASGVESAMPPPPSRRSVTPAPAPAPLSTPSTSTVAAAPSASPLVTSTSGAQSQTEQPPRRAGNETLLLPGFRIHKGPSFKPKPKAT